MFTEKKIQAYSRDYQLLHWGMAALIVLLLIAGQQFNFNLSEEERITGLKLHSSIGTIALLIAAIMVIKRFLLRHQRPNPKLSVFNKFAANTAQISLYIVAIGIPVSGIVAALYSPQPAHLLGLFNISFFSPDHQAFLEYRRTHEILTEIFMLLVFCHAYAALYHNFVKEDGVLKSMLDVNQVTSVLDLLKQRLKRLCHKKG